MLTVVTDPGTDRQSENRPHALPCSHRILVARQASPGNMLMAEAKADISEKSPRTEEVAIFLALARLVPL